MNDNHTKQVNSNAKTIAKKVTKNILKRIDKDLSGQKITCKADACGKLVPDSRLKLGFTWIKGHLRPKISKAMKGNTSWKHKKDRKGSKK